MSELFESLQFPLPPSSSPSTSSCPLQEVGGSSRGNLSNSRTNAANYEQRGNISKAGLQHLQYPRTPLAAKGQKASSLTTSHHRDDQSEITTPLYTSTSTSRLNRPGHVFWHATPSPSQQIRQNEWQRRISSSNSPTLPLGTQAFREELLHQGSSSAASKCRQSLTAGRSEESFSASEKTPCTAGSSSASASAMSRKFSRRISRRSMGGVMGNASMLDKSQGSEGMQQLLADLNQHLQSHENEVDDAEEENLAEELSRVFSSQRELSSPSSSDRQEGQEEHEEKEQMAGLKTSRLGLNIQPSPSSSREWSRTKSLPTLASPRQEGRSSMAKIHSAKILPTDGGKIRHSLTNRTHSPSPRPRSTDSNLSTEGEKGSPASPTKTALEDVWTAQSKGSESGKQVARSKTRSSVSPPKKWETRRTPRIGLSRHSIGASQASGTLQNGPAAPFKRPTKTNHIITHRGATKDKEVIVIDDSDEDPREDQTLKPARRTSPRKKTIVSQHHQQQQKQKQPIDLIQQAKPPAQKERRETDEDTSFDTSMDDSMLCDALDQAEARASQEAFRSSQRIIAPPPVTKIPPIRMSSVGDESFEMASSDNEVNEAIVSAMEAKGW